MERCKDEPAASTEEPEEVPEEETEDLSPWDRDFKELTSTCKQFWNDLNFGFKEYISLENGKHPP